MADQLKWTVDGSNVGAAWISGESGYDVAVLQRVARTDEDGITKTMHGGDGRAIKSERHATTDEQWQGIIDLIAAAPEMLALVREYRQEARACGWGCDSLDAKASALIAKAERLLVSVEVEVEADSGATLDVFKTRALDSVYTGGGVCVSFKGKTVTTLGELYEE
jgi:hypothetical protein